MYSLFSMRILRWVKLIKAGEAIPPYDVGTENQELSFIITQKAVGEVIQRTWLNPTNMNSKQEVTRALPVHTAIIINHLIQYAKR